MRIWFVQFASCMLVCGCLGGERSQPVLNAPPSAARIWPRVVNIGDTPFTLTVIGSGFNPSSVVQLDGSARSTTFVSASELLAQISALDISTTRSAGVTVVNPGTQNQVSSQLILSVASPSPDAASFQLNFRRTNTVTFKTILSPSNWPSTALGNWSVDVGGMFTFPLVAAGKVFLIVVPSSGGNDTLVALDQTTGQIAWGPTPVPMSGPANAVYDAGTVFVLNGSNAALPGVMLAFDAASGALKWSTTLQGQYGFSMAPNAASGLVFAIGDGLGATLWALDESTGAIAWQRNVNADASPTLSDDGLFIMDPCQSFAFRPATGELIWSGPLYCGGGLGFASTFANGLLYPQYPGMSSSGTAFSAVTGLPVGTFPGGGRAIGKQYGYFEAASGLHAVALATQIDAWVVGNLFLTGSPIVVNNYVFSCSQFGILYALDSTSGATVWQQDLSAGGLPAPWCSQDLSAGDGFLLVGSNTTLTAFRLSTNP